MRTKIRRASLAGPPSFFYFASSSDVSISNRAALFQSQYLSRLFRSRSICVSKFLPARPGTLCRGQSSLRTGTAQVPQRPFRNCLSYRISRVNENRSAVVRLSIGRTYSKPPVVVPFQGSVSRRRFAIFLNSAATGESGISAVIGRPRSPDSRVAMSMGIWPNKSTRKRFASRSPPPFPKMS